MRLQNPVMTAMRNLKVCFIRNLNVLRGIAIKRKTMNWVFPGGVKTFFHLSEGGVKLFFVAAEGGGRHFLLTFYLFELYILYTFSIIYTLTLWVMEDSILEKFTRFARISL